MANNAFTDPITFAFFVDTEPLRIPFIFDGLYSTPSSEVTLETMSINISIAAEATTDIEQRFASKLRAIDPHSVRDFIGLNVLDMDTYRET